MDLKTHYLGLELDHPFIVGASPLTDSVEAAKRAEDAGAAAVVMRSLFEEQINAEVLAHHHTEDHTDTFAEATTYLPDPVEFALGPDAYLDTIRRMQEVLQIPVIASLNGVTDGGWLDYAKAIEQAGADALELNLYDVSTDPNEAAVQVEQRYLSVVAHVVQAVKIPISVKLSPFFTSLPHFVRHLQQAGVKGVILFNRYFEPDFDLEELELRPHLELSSPSEVLLRLRWLAILSGAMPELDYSVTGGVHGVREAIKSLMAGADTIQMVSALLRQGPGYLGQIKGGLVAWLQEREYDSLNQLRGSLNASRAPDPHLLERGNYIQMLQTWKLGDE